MRLKSILPMLFLVGTLAAQTNCLITSLTAVMVQANPTNCQYYVVLSFQHTGTTNQFIVTGNGNNYGTFSYTQDPVTLGPFTAAPNASTREFVVSDAINTDCKASINLNVPACSSVAACDIHDLTVQTGLCDPNAPTYELYLNFGFTNPTSSTFDVYAGNGTLLGTYPLAPMPVHILHFPWGGGTTDSIKVCIHDNPHCCATLKFAPPTCLLSNLCIQNLTIGTDGCSSDSTFRAIINFQTIAPAVADSFQVYVGNTFFGTFPYNHLPLTINNFPWHGGPTDTVKICVPLLAQLCCVTKIVQVPDCLPIYPCSITKIKTTVGDCTSDSTFNVSLNFMVKDSMAVDSFDVWGNGNHIGRYALSQLPLNIPNFHWNHQVYNYIKICTGTSAGCCREIIIVAPNCLPFGPCEVSNLGVVPGPCTSDSTYRLLLYFQASNPGNGTYTVLDNGDTLGVFPLTLMPLTIPNFHTSGNATDVVTICINGTQPGAAPCCIKKEFNVPDCIHPKPCSISNLTAVVGPCNPNSNTYSLAIAFQVANPGSTQYNVYTGNNVLLGTFPITQIPLVIQNFPWGGGSVDHIRVCIVNHPDCCAELQFAAPTCIQPCAINDLTVTTGDCNADSTYHITVNFTTSNPPTSTFQLYANGILFGSYTISQLPLTIPNFPWNGQNVDYIKVCFPSQAGTPLCCATKEFPVPTCVHHGPCAISNLTVSTGDCNPDSTFHLTINFTVNNPPLGATTFVVFANGAVFGTYNLSQLPLTIPNFPWNGQSIEGVKVCINSIDPNGNYGCCLGQEFQTPGCLPHPCEVKDLKVVTGTCTSDSTFSITVNFGVNNPPPGGAFTLYANNTLFGTYNLTQLPLTIPNFPWNGTGNGIVKVCLVSTSVPPNNNTCCATVDFSVPTCIFHPCTIQNLTVTTGDCTSDSTYVVTVNFTAVNPSSTGNFMLFANGTQFGTYNLSQLPLTIQNFPWNGANNNVVKVCIIYSTNPPQYCCETKEFPVPSCLFHGPCNITNLTATTGDCNADSTYHLTINFSVSNPPSNTFGVWANGNFFGTYNLSQLPLTIPNFPWNGQNVDYVKVCFSTPAGTVGCCLTKEFPVPPCVNNGACSIYDLKANVGDCTSDSTYVVTVNFGVHNPPSSTFVLYANGNVFGTYNTSQLPLTINNFPWHGGNTGVIKVCFVTNSSPSGCCAAVDFQVPSCIGGGNCNISNLHAVPGDCTGDSTYQLTINFTVTNPPGSNFGVWANGNYLGVFNLSQLPLTIPNFPWNGAANNYVKVCFGNAGIVTCCAITDFAVPPCLTQGGPCIIHNLHVQVGDCTGDSTYQVVVNFNATNPPFNTFALFANGVLFGTYNLNQLPLTIPNFPWNGATVNTVKVCFSTNPGAVTCCAVTEFQVPSCLFNNPCHIGDLHLVATACACDKFFVLLTFAHQNGGNGGFDVYQNGNFVGTYPYNTPQPIILGPFVGDNSTNYEFTVQDHQFHDCHAAAQLGTKNCLSPTSSNDPVNNSHLALSPNPAGDYLHVSAQLANGARAGQTLVEIYHADGRLVRTTVVGDGNDFQLDVSSLPAAMYRLVMHTEVGRLEATFAKQ
jgi:hypothetical protein